MKFHELLAKLHEHNIKFEVFKKREGVIEIRIEKITTVNRYQRRMELLPEHWAYANGYLSDAIESIINAEILAEHQKHQNKT